MTFVRLRPDVSAAAGLAAMRRVTAGVDRELAAVSPASPCHGDVLGVLPVQHPAQIANYAALSAAPSLLAAGLAGGAVAALFLTLFASVRRRRQDLAVLKTIGFTRRQLAATVAWQATVAAIVGSAVGIPLGIALAGGCGPRSPGRSTRCRSPRCPSSPSCCCRCAPWRWSTWWPRSPAGQRPGPRPPWPCARSEAVTRPGCTTA